ncbi:hypothetical protein HanRHA438_Chr14g0655951 [Helianthus annuus]|nr:hypothetical protein HanRHA438_Chr14g0655951 [Helianthus annuus]
MYILFIFCVFQVFTAKRSRNELKPGNAKGWSGNRGARKQARRKNQFWSF